MATRDELELLTSKELHDRAVSRAERHLDLKFFYDLLRTIPAAEASTGDLDDANADIFTLRGLVNGLADADEGELADALRPFYIDYLVSHDG
jgi:hypothetical protein